MSTQPAVAAGLGPQDDGTPLIEATEALHVGDGLDEHSDVALLPQQASGAIVSLCRADVLACIPRDAERIEAGSAIEVYALEELGLR